MIPYPHNYDADLKCCWTAWRITGPGTLSLALPPHNCTDMTGAIRVGRRILPHVSEIATFSGGTPDTIYRREGEKWHAVGRGPKHGFVVEDED